MSNEFLDYVEDIANAIEADIYAPLIRLQTDNQSHVP